MKLISTALVKAQKEFAPALKTNSNTFFQSKYVGLDGCIEAVIDALNNNGIYFMQKSHPNDTGIAVETIFIHESGESISGGVLTVPALKNDPQAYGSALTYARRYSLMAACGIAPEDDDGNAASRSKPVIKQEQPALKSVQIEDFASEEQDFLRDTAAQMIAFIVENQVKEAHALTVSLDNDEKLALWSLLDSKTRTAIKKYSQSINSIKEI
jgi:hypothetical protein